ncbi:hypothetical protein GMA19_01084 [Paenibacillus polymyxa E681]|nr:hypothetical protein [Paenibacillus polymyxa]QNV55931.1 hypothetical protein GE561_01084 [Paenibacillus polymyxa E681]QNV60768.1 hypothetical protein GMA19_01084 [Paenibacillus polymyxa E681]
MRRHVQTFQSQLPVALQKIEMLVGSSRSQSLTPVAQQLIQDLQNFNRWYEGSADRIGAAAKDRNPLNIQENEQREEMAITRNQRTNFTVFAAPLCLFTWMFISFGLGLLMGITFIVCIIVLVISGVDNRRNRSAVDKFINKFIFPSGLFSIEAILVMIQMMAVTVFYLIIL